nr:PHP domain-containing protein [uncultured Holophaga sp.]
MIDLHCHSTFSDGTDSPTTLVTLARDLGLSALALTDHDTLDGLDEFLTCPVEGGPRRIPGIEFSCRYLGMELHILGLLFKPSHAPLRAHVQDLKQRREERNRAMLVRLGDLGLKVTWEDIRIHASSDLVSRAHFAKALHRLRIAGSPQDAFQRFLGEGRPAYVPFRDLEPAEACRWIREAGGVALVAHPGRSLRRDFRWEDAMPELKGMGVVGFEASYPDYSSREEHYFHQLARSLDMIPSGGSDYHGSTKPGICLGVGRGTLAVDESVLEALERSLPR